MTPMQSVRDLLDGAGATPDNSATWTAPERRDAVERDQIRSFGDFARAVSSVFEENVLLFQRSDSSVRPRVLKP